LNNQTTRTLLDVGADPVDVGGGPAVHAGIAGNSAAVTPGDNTAVNLGWAAGQWATRVTLYKKRTL